MQGNFVFTGRRDVRQFMLLAKELNLKVFARIGPWDHGECRNGGHPDWVLQAAKDGHFALRNNNSEYLALVRPFYAQLAKQFDGLYFKDGGPIVYAQVDNETPDCDYLMALRSLALSVGIKPAGFAKTGWPAPSHRPADLPLLPAFGQYPDQFWFGNNASSMHPSHCFGCYLFGTTGSKPTNGVAPFPYPTLLVELGGGMAADYSHRTHLSPPDMPALHLMKLAQGVSSYGFYVYHGGNNPHSLTGSDAPEDTLQESSFEPAGVHNSMPSISYDFFAPLGEFGQPRPHFHSMRRMHLLLNLWGGLLTEWETDFPDFLPTGTDDNTTVRFAVRSNGTTGVLLVNNHRRVYPLPPKQDVRFSLTLAGSGQQAADPVVLNLPLKSTDGFDIASGVFFVLAFNLPVGPAGSFVLRQTTCQLLTQATQTSQSRTVVFFHAVEGVAPELVFAGPVTAAAHGSTIDNLPNGDVHVYGFEPSHASVVTLSTLSSGGQQGVVDVVVVPWNEADTVWTGHINGQFTVMQSNANMVIADNDTIRIRSENTTAQVSVFPSNVTGDGVFGRWSAKVASPSVPTVHARLIKEAAPPRVVPTVRGGQAREPNSTDWLLAARYNVTVTGLDSTPPADLVLVIDYDGDSGRIFYNNRLLTDNWNSGYGAGDGGFQVGLSYLAGENPGLLSGTTELELLLMPVCKHDLETSIYLQQRLWPDFGDKDCLLNIKSIEIKPLWHFNISF